MGIKITEKDFFNNFQFSSKVYMYSVCLSVGLFAYALTYVSILGFSCNGYIYISDVTMAYSEFNMDCVALVHSKRHSK